MAHSSEIRWPQVAAIAEEATTNMVSALLLVESKYHDLLELFAYCGSTAQGLADQLFKEDWEARSTPGLPAILTFDVVGDAVTAVFISQAGSGYVDAIGYQMYVAGGAGDAIISYDVVAGAVTNAAVVSGGTTYTPGTGQLVNNVPQPGDVFDTQASAAEVLKTQDLIDASTALHEMYLAAANGIVAQEDRFTQMRRFT